MKDKDFKVFIVAIIILLVLCFIWGVLAVYKATIFNKIFKNMQEKILLDNYYMKMTSKDSQEGSMEFYYKNGTGKLVASNGVYTWTDGKEAYIVIDESKTYLKLNLDAPRVNFK